MELSSFDSINNNLIYIFPPECYLVTEETIFFEKKIISIPKINNLSNILFLLYTKPEQKTKEIFLNYKYLIITNPNKPYLLFFEFLKYFFPKINLINEEKKYFIAKYKDLGGFSIINQDFDVEDSQVKNKILSKNSGTSYYLLIFCLIILIIFNFLLNILCHPIS